MVLKRLENIVKASLNTIFDILNIILLTVNFH